MSKIVINIEETMKNSSKISSAKENMIRVSSEIGTVQRQTDGKILNRNNIDYRLSHVKNVLLTASEELFRIQREIERGARQYQENEKKIKYLSENVTAAGMTIDVKKGNGIYSSYFKEANQSTDYFGKSVGADGKLQITDEQMKQLQEAISNNDKLTALSILGIMAGENNAEEEKLAESLWQSLREGFKKNIRDDVQSGLIDEMLESGGNWISQCVASHINMNHLLHVGPVSTASFVILDPQVAGKTASMMSGVSASLSIGIPVIGGILDYASMRAEGEATIDAGIKAAAHVGIGIAGGKAGAAIGASIGSVIPGVGTVVGGIVGFASGVVITTAGNALFDVVYDNRDKMADAIKETGNQVKEWFSDVGNAWSDGWNSLGSIFG